MWVPLSSVLSKKTNILKNGLANTKMTLAWKDAIKEAYPGAVPYTEYSGFYNNTLHIKVKDPIWLVELEGYKDMLKKQMSIKTKKNVNTIRFTVG